MKFLIPYALVLTATVFSASIVQTINAPGTDVLGLAWQNDGTLWATDYASGYAYKLDPATGSVLFSFYPDYSASYWMYGMACSNDTLFIDFGKASGGGMHSMYDADNGAYLGNVPLC